MQRREFLGVSAGALGVASAAPARPIIQTGTLPAPGSNKMRELFPRSTREVFLNAAGGTPLSGFAETGLRKYEDFWKLGPGDGRVEYARTMLGEIRGLFGSMIGAEASEIGLVHCTKAGEQIVLDGLPAIRKGGNIVTNDLHFNGSLHNLVGLRKAGVDVRIVRSKEWATDFEAMERAVDDKTALVSISLISNINGHVEPIQRLSNLAHAHGAYLFADIIQAAGVYPIDVRAMGIDFAACSGYKWLYGPHGVGFFFARNDLQGAALEDRLFPGHMRHNYSPWVETADSEKPDFPFVPAGDAGRYQPGHISYLGYSALFEALKFLSTLGVSAARAHSIKLNQRLLEQIDASRFQSISMHWKESPILTLVVPEPKVLGDRVAEANISVSFSGNRLRISPGLYNDEEDMGRVASVLNSA